MSRLIALDDEAASDPAVVGGKAALLALARRHRLPVPRGSVLPCGAARPALERATALAASRGSPAARAWLAGYRLDAPLVQELESAARALGPRAVVRSSSPLEAHAAWSGAFVSYIDLAPSEVALGVTGVWSSLYSRAADELAELTSQDPRRSSIAVLVQPSLKLQWGGTARLNGDRVEVRGTSGSVPALLSGWERGAHALIGPRGEAGRLTGDLPCRLASRVAELVRRVSDELGGSDIEWGLDIGDHLHLLQVHRREPAEAPPAELIATELTTIAAQRVAAAVASTRGSLLDDLVLPWVAAYPGPIIDPSPMGDGSPTDAREALALADRLTAMAWAMEAALARERAARVLEGLASGDPTALAELKRLRAIPAEDGARLLGLMRGIGRTLANRGHLPDPDAVWQLPRALVTSGGTIAGQIPLERGRGWEPLVFGVAWSSGRHVTGDAAAPGRRAGRLARISLPPERALPRARVIHAEAPHPVLAPLLWSAVGIVTDGGDPAAHLVDVARSLNVPAITGLDLGAVGSTAIAAVDGDRGEVALLEPLTAWP